MSKTLDKIPPQLTSAEVRELVNSGEAKFMSYGYDTEFFAILTGKDATYKNGGEMYYLLPKPPEKNPTP